jgi:hypothetical protein
MDIWFIDHVYTSFGTHIITASLLISTIHRSTQHLLSRFPACCVFSRSLATALTVEILELPALTSLLSCEYPATELMSTVNLIIAPSLLSLPCRAQLNCKHSTDNWTGQSQSQSQNQSYFTTGSLRPISLSWRQAPWDSRPENFFLPEPLRS